MMKAAHAYTFFFAVLIVHALFLAGLLYVILTTKFVVIKLPEPAVQSAPSATACAANLPAGRPSSFGPRGFIVSPVKRYVRVTAPSCRPAVNLFVARPQGARAPSPLSCAAGPRLRRDHLRASRSVIRYD